MSARSSSGSWSGAGGAPPDIIDLDKFMRGAVRPARTDVHTMRCGDKLVVDAGGVDRKPGLLAAAGAPALPPPPPVSVPSDSSGSRVPPHGKRFSHDSGLSETSYARRKHRPHRRAAAAESPAARAPRAPAAAAAGSSDSLRAFRVVCEQALMDQQAQIARVAQLCERLSERAATRHRSDRSATDTSEVSSSSRSTRDQRRKDKHRTDECKTYKIIMNKLDELNRLFAARARSPPPAVPPRCLPASSGSVSVSDKLVATEPERGVRPDMREVLVAHNVVTMRGGSAYGACGAAGGSSAAGAGGAGGAGGSSRLSGMRAHTCTLDIAPRDALLRPKVVTESVVVCESRAGTGTSGDPRCGFDLDDPVHLYSQAKRLQAMSMTTRRARSAEASEPRAHPPRAHPAPRAQSHARARAERPRELSLCSLCRGYWRALANYLAAQLFCCPDAAVR